MNLNWWVVIVVWASTALTFRNLHRTYRAHRRTAQAYARIRLSRESAVESLERIAQSITGVQHCSLCGLPYALMGPDTWEHPYCPENLVTA